MPSDKLHAAGMRILSDHSGLTALTKPTKKMNSVRLAGWAAKLQNITTASGEFSIEYSSGSSKAISSGADALSTPVVPMEPIMRAFCHYLHCLSMPKGPLLP
jgi:hypothetical protein